MKNRDIVFHFIATVPTPMVQLKLGYSNMNEEFDFVLRSYEEGMQSVALDLCSSCDVLLIGGDTSCEKYIPKDKRDDQIVFLCSERIFKKNIIKNIIRFIVYAHRRKNYKGLYLLSYGEYAYRDYVITGSFREKGFLWAYFTKTRQLPILKHTHEKRVVEVVWAGRFVGWKHPEYCIVLASHLKKKGSLFHITMIGDGEEKSKIERQIANKGLTSFISCVGSLQPDSVYEIMDKADVYLFTSDSGEGWGVVLNEAMMSGCAIVASDLAGATSSLLTDGINGLVYPGRNKKEFLKKCDLLFSDMNEMERLGNNAYKSITENWNADVASSRLLHLCRQIREGKTSSYNSGLCKKL